MPKLPDRWLKYETVGDIIQLPKGPKFITFKVPLKESFFAYKDTIPKDRRFTPTTLLECMSGRGLKLDLVIDLTNTNKYYDEEEFKKKDVLYEKIPVKGKDIPNQEVIDSFYKAIDPFLEKSEEDKQKSTGKDGPREATALTNVIDTSCLIGVHCTHGVNRTGYVMCRYMMEHLGMKAKDALDAYAKARGHLVENEDYKNDLKAWEKKLFQKTQQKK